MFLFLFILGLILLVDLEDLRPLRDGRFGFLLRWLIPPLPDEPEEKPIQKVTEKNIPIDKPGKYGQRVDTFKTPQLEEEVDGISTLAWEISTSAEKENLNNKN